MWLGWLFRFVILQAWRLLCVGLLWQRARIVMLKFIHGIVVAVFTDIV